MTAALICLAIGYLLGSLKHQGHTMTTENQLLRVVRDANASFETWATKQGYDLTREDGALMATYRSGNTEHAWRGYCHHELTHPAQSAEGLRTQHDADSAELRRLCQARDNARRERDAARAEIAGLESSVVRLSAMVDAQTRLVQKAVAIMKTLHESATPIDGPDMDACIPGRAFHVFVDGHAELMHALSVGPQITTAPPASQEPKGLGMGTQALAGELAEALNKDTQSENCIGMLGQHTMAWLRNVAAEYLRQPASQEQAQQPGVCAACVMPEQCAVDIAERGPCSGGVQQPSGGEVVAWRWMPSHVYPQWVYSDDPARVAEAKRFMGEGGVQPLTLATPKPEPMTEHQRGGLVMEHLGLPALMGDKMSPLDAFTLGIEATERFYGITKGEA